MKRVTGIIMILVISFFAGCNPSKKTFNNADKWIPKDFNPSQTTILIEKFSVSKKAQQQMEDYMSEKYSYKYEFAPISEIENKSGKYADLKKYKYAIIYSTHNTIWREVGKSSGGVQVTGFDYNFVDRQIDKVYPPTNRASSYAIMTFKAMINTIVSRY